MQQEIWKPIPEFEGLYEASSIGKIKSIKRVVHRGKGTTRIVPEKLLAKIINDRGYVVVTLGKNGNSYRMRLHRVIAVTFIENPNNLLEINHMDGNKLNNSIENLEWCSRSQNIKHAYDIGLKKSIKGTTRSYYRRSELNSPSEI